METYRRVLSALVGALVLGASFSPAGAFIPDQRWNRTSFGSTGQPGDPMTLSWSIVRDGTFIPDQGVGSNLVSFLDGLFGGGPGGNDFTLRPWFRFFNESFARWGALGGISYVYEPNDDGTQHGLLSGQTNLRGDVRIGGAPIDGVGNVLAYNQLPPGGDMVLDTGDGAFFSNAIGDYRRFRNTIMHEHGHGIGLQHVESNTDALLMEPFINNGIDGPQLDEVRGVHYFYGDAHEKAEGGQGNDVPERATPLGTLVPDVLVSIGVGAAGVSQAISPAEIDFVSIDRITDVDYYRFRVDDASWLDVTLTPRGGVFNQTAQGGTPTEFDANARVKLVLEILAAEGAAVLQRADAAPIGQAETIVQLGLGQPGDYLVKITGLNDSVQLYQLDLRIDPQLQFEPADFNRDGQVDAADLQAWSVATWDSADADADGNGRSDGLDLLAWQRGFGAGSSSALSGSPVPEPRALALLALALVSLAAWRPRSTPQKPQAGPHAHDHAATWSAATWS